MPTYLLHLKERDHLFQDGEGIEFPDLPAAQAEARRAIREIVAEHLSSGEELRLRSIEICDENGGKLATVGLAAAISAVIPISEDAFERPLYENKLA